MWSNYPLGVVWLNISHTQHYYLNVMSFLSTFILRGEGMNNLVLFSLRNSYYKIDCLKNCSGWNECIKVNVHFSFFTLSYYVWIMQGMGDYDICLDDTLRLYPIKSLLLSTTNTDKKTALKIKL